MARFDFTKAHVELADFYEFLLERLSDVRHIDTRTIQDYLATSDGARLLKDLLKRPAMCDVLLPGTSILGTRDPEERERIIETMAPYLPNSDRQTRLQFGLYFLTSAQVFHGLHRLLRAKKPPKLAKPGDEPLPPPQPMKSKIELNRTHREFRIGKKWHLIIGDNQIEFLDALMKERGVLVPGKILCAALDTRRLGSRVAIKQDEPPRADKIFKSLPEPVRKIIQVVRGRGGGYRIYPKYFD